MKGNSNKRIKELINEEVSLCRLWLRSLRRRPPRNLSGLRSAQRDVRGSGGGLDVLTSEQIVTMMKFLGEMNKPDTFVRNSESPVNNELSDGDLSLKLLEFGLKFAVASRRILLLDYDGTLAPFRVERLEATPYPGVQEAISRIMASGDRIVVISGRSAGEVAQLIGITPTPEIWGCHGWERLSGGELRRVPLHPKQEEKLFKAGYALKNAGYQSRLEYKHGSLALHWRGVSEPEEAAILIAGLRAMEPLTGDDMIIHRFDGGLELRAIGRDKGVVVNEILAGVEPGVVVAYLGDDQTDEDAFRAIKGRGLGVLVREEPRPTSADIWLKPPAQLLAFLDLWTRSKENRSFA